MFILCLCEQALERSDFSKVTHSKQIRFYDG